MRIVKTSLSTRLSYFSLLAVCLFMQAPFAMAAFAQQSKDINIQADQQVFDSAKSQTLFKGHVKVQYKDVRIAGTEAILEMDPAGSPQVANFLKRPKARKISITGKEDIVDANIIRVYLGANAVRAEGNVVSYITSMAAEPFTIRSDVQQYDNVNKSVAALGMVNVNYKNGTANSPKALVTLGADGKAEKVTFLGGAKLKNTDGDVVADKITIETASGNMIAEKNVVTNGAVKDENNTPTKVRILSDYQQYDKASGTMLASGNAVIYYQDYIAKGPKATFKLKGNQVDKIILTGRGQIQDDKRTVVADTIVITMKPKHFDAYGNVKTRFKAEPAGTASPGAASGKPAPSFSGTGGPSGSKTSTPGSAAQQPPKVPVDAGDE